VALLKMHLPGSFRVIREGKFFPSPAKSCFQTILFHAILHAFNLILSMKKCLTKLLNNKKEDNIHQTRAFASTVAKKTGFKSEE